MADLLRLAGGVNVFGDEPQRYPTVTPEQATARGVQVLLFPSEPYPFREEKHGALVEQIFGKEPRRLFVAGDDLTWHGVRTLDGLAAARRLRVYAVEPPPLANS